MKYLLFPFRLVAVTLLALGGIGLLLGFVLIQFLKGKELNMRWTPFFLLALMSCKTVPYVPVVEVPMNGLYGATNCDQNGNPIIMLDPDRRKTTLRHERQHVRDMIAYPGGCTAFLARYRTDVSFRFMAELRAYCAESSAKTDSITLQNIATLVSNLNSLPNRVEIRNPCGDFENVAINTPDG
jgi:hypothetical protein